MIQGLPTLLAGALLLSACAQPTPFSLQISNDGLEALFSDAAGAQPLARLFIDQGDGPEEVLRSMACIDSCAFPSPMSNCVLAAIIPQPFALLPGDSVTIDFDGKLPVLSPRGCFNNTNHHGDISVEYCHAIEVLDFNGGAIDPPETTGLVDTFDYDSLVDPICESAVFNLDESETFVLSVGAQ